MILYLLCIVVLLFVPVTVTASIFQDDESTTSTTYGGGEEQFTTPEVKKQRLIQNGNEKSLDLLSSLGKQAHTRPGMYGSPLYEITNTPKTQSLYEPVPVRIIGGSSVRAGTYPWFARALKDKFSRWNNCGGSLVSSEFVLTAAHCIGPYFLEDFSGYEIGALCEPFARNDNCGQRLERQFAKEVYVHPSFVKSTYENDFALVRLEGPVSAVSPVTMDLNNAVNGYVNGKKLWVAGFGTTVSGSLTDFPENLLHAEVSFVNEEMCVTSYGDGHITGDMMCAAQSGMDACQGDSGGPLYDPENELLVGVISWGIGCASDRYPGVYAKVASASEWIKSTICDNSLESTKPNFCKAETPQPTRVPTKAPTKVPTKAPTTPPEPVTISPTASETITSTFAPTLQLESCHPTESRLSVSVYTDSYPYESSWNITDFSGQLILESDEFSLPDTVYRESKCISTTECYTFTIFDTYGDGLINNGTYSVRFDGGSELSPMVPFTFKQTVLVGSCSNVTLSPTSTPTAPTPSPTPQLEPCIPSQKRISVSVYTDSYPDENHWEIKTISGVLKLSSQIFTESYSQYTDSICLWKKQCLVFTIYDDFGDGLTSEKGYSVKWDGEELNPINRPFQYEQSLYIGGTYCEPYTLWPTMAPTATNWPTFDFNSLTFAPTVQPKECENDLLSRVDVIVVTDLYPNETSWQIEDSSGNIVLESEPYLLQDYRYMESACLPKSDCYIFTIYDTYGDGISSLVEGGLKLKWDGQEIRQANEFWTYEQQLPFGDANNCDSCLPGQKLLTLELNTDSYGGETYWDLKKTNNNGKFRDYLWGGYEIEDFYLDNRNYVESYCVPQKHCYRFIMRDSYGDGLCCSNGEGNWTLSYGGKVIRYSNFSVATDSEKYNEYSRRFGKCEQWGW